MKVIGCVVVCSFLVGGASAGAWSDDDQAMAAFGQGVHAYFDGRYDVANKLLSESIESCASDPRPYFFRGLVHQLLGQTQLASGDFQKGAAVELSLVGRSFDVDDSLERIQGPTRIEIEKYRREAAVRAKELRRGSNSVVDREDRVQATGQGTPLDPRNLPDVSQIVDATIPFPEISAKPYYPPAKSAADIQDSSQKRAGAAAKSANTTPQGPPPQAGDDPFNTGGQGAKPNDSKPQKNAAERPDPKSGKGDKPESKGDNPFGGG